MVFASCRSFVVRETEALTFVIQWEGFSCKFYKYVNVRTVSFSISIEIILSELHCNTRVCSSVVLSDAICQQAKEGIPPAVVSIMSMYCTWQCGDHLSYVAVFMRRNKS